MGISAPPAGRAPKGKPSAVPRSHAGHDRRQSAPSIHGFPLGMTSAGVWRRWAAIHSASPTANRATATTTVSMPVDRASTPNVSRCCPVSASMPTRPRVSPSARAASPRTGEEPRTVETATNEMSVIAK